MEYSVEVCSINGGTDILQWHKRKTKNAALKLASKLSKKYNATGINKEGWQSQESVWVEVFDEVDRIEHYQFIDGVKSYYHCNN